jgi:hypothetical protein
MLTPVSPSTSSNPIQIVRQAVLNQTLYTVPSGRKFYGAFFHTGAWNIVINGVAITSHTSMTFNGPPSPITLTEGTVVSCGGSYASWSLVGIEVDAGKTLDGA